MNGQIRIRIWDKQNRKWLFRGDVLSEAMLLSLSMIGDYSNYEVSRDTGMKDKKGCEIWEGDYFYNGHTIERIYFSGGIFWFDVYIGTAIELHDLYEVCRKGNSWVVGNIYEDDKEDLYHLIPYLVDYSDLSDYNKKLLAENTPWNENTRIFRLIKDKLFRLIKMEITEGLALSEQPMCAPEQPIYSHREIYLAVLPQWYQYVNRFPLFEGYFFVDQIKDRIFSAIWGNLWTSCPNRQDKFERFYIQTKKGKHLIEIKLSQIERDSVLGSTVSILLEDSSFKTPTRFETNEFLQKAKFIDHENLV
jgi:hypothetical protein